MISRLRQKLGDSVKPPRFIQTVWGRGYSFVGVPLSDD
jgi:DNA-binding response OmpR family regulator